MGKKQLLALGGYLQEISTGFVFAIYWVIFLAAGMLSIIVATYFLRWSLKRGQTIEQVSEETAATCLST